MLLLVCKKCEAGRAARTRHCNTHNARCAAIVALRLTLQVWKAHMRTALALCKSVIDPLRVCRGKQPSLAHAAQKTDSPHP